jgi:hypothetical protein
MLKSVHRRGQSWADWLRVKLGVDDLRLLREGEQRGTEEESGEEVQLHGDLLKGSG